MRERGGRAGGAGATDGAGTTAGARAGGDSTVSSIGPRAPAGAGGRKRASARPTNRCSASEAASTRPSTPRLYPRGYSSAGASSVSDGICRRGSPFISSSTRLTIISLPSARSMSSPSSRSACGMISPSSSST